MNTQTSELSARLTGQTDALFAPVRLWEPPHLQPSIYTLQAAYADRGLPWRPGTKDQTEQKRLERALDELAGSGHADIFRGGTGRAVAFRLTDAGYWSGRHVARMPNRANVVSFLAHLAALGKTPEACIDGSVYEHVAADVEAGAPTEPVELDKLTAFVAPARLFGWITVGVEMSGRCRFSLTDTGREAIDAETDGAGETYDAPKRFADAYWNAFDDYRRGMRALGELDGSQIAPLPVAPAMTKRQNTARARRLKRRATAAASRDVGMASESKN